MLFELQRKKGGGGSQTYVMQGIRHGLRRVTSTVTKNLYRAYVVLLLHIYYCTVQPTRKEIHNKKLVDSRALGKTKRKVTQRSRC